MSDHKRYVLFAISTKPFNENAINEIGGSNGIRHFIKKEVGIKPGMRVEESAPECCSGKNFIFCGQGPSERFAILDWLRNLIFSLYYKPIGNPAETPQSFSSKKIPSMGEGDVFG